MYELNSRYFHENLENEHAYRKFRMPTGPNRFLPWMLRGTAPKRLPLLSPQQGPQLGALPSKPKRKPTTSPSVFWPCSHKQSWLRIISSLVIAFSASTPITAQTQVSNQEPSNFPSRQHTNRSAQIDILTNGVAGI